MKKIFLILLICLILVGCNNIKDGVSKKDKKEKKESTRLNIPSDYNDNGIFEEYYEKAYKKLKSMKVEEKVGQMLLVRMSSEATSMINDYNVAGFVMFANDFKDKTKEDIKREINQYQKLSKIPLLFAVDEEGGSVVRISKYKNFREYPFSSPQDIYKQNGMNGIIEDTKEKSILLNSLGININLAPVSDVAENNDDFIYDRSFGVDASLTAEYVKNVVKTYNENNMGSCLKHFPGYGNNVDTHTGIAIDKREYSNFENNDFIPFIEGIKEGVPSILVSHNIVESMDSVPASLSLNVHNILREKLKFTGVIMTDDLDMDAIKKYVSNPNVEAVKSGNNLLLTTDYKTSYNDIINAYNNKEISLEMIDKAVFKVLAWKYSMGVLND